MSEPGIDVADLTVRFEGNVAVDTVSLSASSPALDHVASGCPPPATDQRGVTRPGGSTCDSGAFEAVPSLSIDPVSKDFGTVTVGQSSGSQRFIVRNTGDLPVPLTGVTTTDPQFAVQPGSDPGRCPVTLAVGATCFVDVVFTPGAPGGASATLRVTSSNAGAVQAALTGTAVAVPPPPPPPPDPCASDRAAPKVRIVSDQGRRLYGVGQTASITTTASDASGLAVDPSRKRQPISTSKPGLVSVTKRARDKCGRTAARTFRYRVVAAPTATIVHRASRPGCRTRFIAAATIVSEIALRRSQILVDGRVLVTSTKKRLLARVLTRRLRRN